MKNFVKISCVLAFLFFFVNGQNVDAQSSRKNKKVLVIKKDNRRVPSKRVVYRKPVKKVVSIRILPNRTTIVHRGINYYYSGNRFYSYSGGRYIVITPKIGFRIKTLPVGYVGNAYEVVEPELGTVIYELPQDAERVEIDGYSYYEFSNVLYEKIQLNGERAYEVVGFIEQ